MKQIFKFTSRTLALIALCLICSSVSAKDVIKTVADKGKSGKFFAMLCPTTTVAIDKDDADVFSVFTDGADARFAQGVFRNNKYNIKPGECVIIKTSEEKEVKIETTSSTKTSFLWNDFICPAADQTLEEFKTANGVTEGQYIYLLTNLERNGGFGFTRFTGDIMRKGYFFFVTTVGSEPTETRSHKTRAAHDFEDGDLVPFLPGEAGNDDGFITVATPAETSFVRGDANGDGDVDTKDVEAISYYIVGKPIASFVMEAADVNEDGVINVLDIVGVVDIIMNAE